VGEYSGVTRTLHLERCQVVSWSKVPKDRTVTRIQQTRVNLTIYTCLVITASMGIVLGFGFLAVNIKYRHQKQIKMSSPNLNNLIIIGCVLSYTSVIILGLDSTLTSQAAFPYVCAGKAWSLMAGFTLSFGSMFSKTWRVHSIFTNVQLNKKVMKDSQLFLVVGILLTIDIVIMTTWQVFDPFFRDTYDLRPYVSTHT
jgi:gamma-aminobutyric acid type B receptor